MPKILILMVRSSLVLKWPISVPFCGMDHQKSNFSLIFDTLPVGGCWGQPMSIFWKLVDETQISKPPEPTRHHKSIKLWILLPLRADLLVTLPNEIPCITTDLFHFFSWQNSNFLIKFPTLIFQGRWWIQEEKIDSKMRKKRRKR